MNINDCFPSAYLKASDLKDPKTGRPKTYTLVMSGVEWVKVGSDEKLHLKFQGAQKGMILNKTNANTIAAIYGPDTGGWMAK